MWHWLTRYKALRAAGVLGMNERNADIIMGFNPRRLYPLVDNKILCKQRLLAHAIPVPELLACIKTQHDASHLSHILNQHPEFAIKPANGSGGNGILVAIGKRNRQWVSPSGRLMNLDAIEHYVSNILSGMYSLGGQPDSAMIEALLHVHPCFEGFALQGVPDTRVIVFRGYPVMAMIRLPTRHSDGKANLHQGAVGSGLDLCDGTTTHAVLHNHAVTEHPDTGALLSRFQLPFWQAILSLAARCSDAIGLGYLGADIVIDRTRGPLVLELNARPGLSIQIANHAGLRQRLQLIAQLPDDAASASIRVARAQALHRQDWQSAAVPAILQQYPASAAHSDPDTGAASIQH